MIRNKKIIEKVVKKILAKGNITFIKINDNDKVVIVEYSVNTGASNLDIVFLERIIESNIEEDCEVRGVEV